jgi:hypothetical protein
MTVDTLIALLPLIESVLKDAPQIVSDVEAIIARVRGGTAASVTDDDAVKIMASVDAELSKFR